MEKEEGVNIKKYLLGLAITFSLIPTVFLYWPIYQPISLINSKSDVTTEINRLDLPLGDDIKEILDRKIDLPLDRHELCLTNKNQIYLIHADSLPELVFQTNDISRSDIAKDKNVGAMAINIYYKNGLDKDKIYRKAGQEKSCMTLQMTKLQDYASSTIEYHHFGFGMLEEFDLGSKGRIKIARPVVGASLINTTQSSAFIITRWEFFLSTFAAFFIFFLPLINCILKLLGRKKKIGLIERQRREKERDKETILDLLETQGSLTNNHVQMMLGISDATAMRYLEELEKEGRVRQVGDTGSGVYYKKP